MRSLVIPCTKTLFTRLKLVKTRIKWLEGKSQSTDQKAALRPMWDISALAWGCRTCRTAALRRFTRPLCLCSLSDSAFDRCGQLAMPNHTCSCACIAVSTPPARWKLLYALKHRSCRLLPLPRGCVSPVHLRKAAETTQASYKSHACLPCFSYLTACSCCVGLPEFSCSSQSRSDLLVFRFNSINSCHLIAALIS